MLIKREKYQEFKVKFHHRISDHRPKMLSLVEEIQPKGGHTDAMQSGKQVQDCQIVCEVVWFFIIIFFFNPLIFFLKNIIAGFRTGAVLWIGG